VHGRAILLCAQKKLMINRHYSLQLGYGMYLSCGVITWTSSAERFVDQQMPWSIEKLIGSCWNNVSLFLNSETYLENNRRKNWEKCCFWLEFPSWSGSLDNKFWKYKALLKQSSARTISFKISYNTLKCIKSERIK